MSFIAELKRRNVFRAALAYLALAWLLTEVADTLFPAFGIPDWGFRFLVIVFALGFVPTLIFSWVYELTPEGLKRDKDVVRDESITPITARRLDKITIGLIVLVGAFVLVDRLWLGTADPGTPSTVVNETMVPQRAVPEAAAPANSIAVLSFINLSDDKGQEYFADGLSDTLIQLLAQVSGLKVIANTSSSSFKGKNINVGEIARELNVSTILQGSVQKSGNQIRVIAKLVNAGDGTHLWSDSFDSDLQDIFAIQDEIAQAIVKALKVTLLGTEEERLAQRYQPTLEAYYLFLQGRFHVAKRGGRLGKGHQSAGAGSCTRSRSRRGTCRIGAGLCCFSDLLSRLITDRGTRSNNAIGVSGGGT